MLNLIIWICIFLVLIFTIYRIYSNIRNISQSNDDVSQTGVSFDTTGQLAGQVGGVRPGAGFTNTQRFKERFADNTTNPCENIIFTDLETINNNKYCFLNFLLRMNLFSDEMINLIDQQYYEYFEENLSDALDNIKDIYSITNLTFSDYLRVFIPLLVYDNYNTYYEEFLTISLGPMLKLQSIMGGNNIDFYFDFCENETDCKAKNQTFGYIYYKFIKNSISTTSGLSGTDSTMTNELPPETEGTTSGLSGTDSTITNELQPGTKNTTSELPILNDITITYNMSNSIKNEPPEAFKLNPAEFVSNLIINNRLHLLPTEIVYFINKSDVKSEIKNIIIKIFVLDLHYAIKGYDNFKPYIELEDLQLNKLVEDILFAIETFRSTYTPNPSKKAQPSEKIVIENFESTSTSNPLEKEHPSEIIVSVLYKMINYKISENQTVATISNNLVTTDNDTVEGDPWVHCSKYNKNADDCNNNSPFIDFIDGWYKCKYNTDFNYCDTERIKNKTINMEQPQQLQQTPPTKPPPEDLSAYADTAPLVDDIYVACMEVVKDVPNPADTCNAAVFNDKNYGLKGCIWKAGWCDPLFE